MSSLPTEEKMNEQTPKSTDASDPSLLHPQSNPAEAKKIANLEAKIAGLETQIREVGKKQKDMDGKLEGKDPNVIVQAHIKLLHDYNEIRDIGQGLMGIIADNRGVRVSDVYKDFDVGEDD